MKYLPLILAQLIALAGCTTTPTPTRLAVSAPPLPPIVPTPTRQASGMLDQATPGPKVVRYRIIRPEAGSGVASLQLFASRKVTPSPSVTFAWDQSPTPSAIGYNLYCGPTSHAYTTLVDAGNSNTITVSNLAFSSTYFFAVTAYTSEQESDYSNEVTYSTPGTALPPGNLRVSGSFAFSPDGPWLPETNWPPILVSNPLGNQFWRVQAEPVPTLTP